MVEYQLFMVMFYNFQKSVQRYRKKYFNY